ncbi:hypothetical protein PT2222_20360 [Paraburkholderia tropica]
MSRARLVAVGGIKAFPDVCHHFLDPAAHQCAHFGIDRRGLGDGQKIRLDQRPARGLRAQPVVQHFVRAFAHGRDQRTGGGTAAWFVAPLKDGVELVNHRAHQFAARLEVRVERDTRGVRGGGNVVDGGRHVAARNKQFERA